MSDAPPHLRVQPGWAADRAARFAAQFADVFRAVAETAVKREIERVQPFAQVAALREAGFTRLTLPVEFGGLGATPAELFEMLARLAQADPNLAQLFRSHFALIDRLTVSAADPRRERILRLIADGAIFGNASHEHSAAQVGALDTRLTRDGDGWLLDGRKFYSTGTLFADWISVSAQTADGRSAGVIVATEAAGVERIDDWTGFGQRFTGSGTTVFDHVAVDTQDIVWRLDDRGPSHAESFLQLVLLACVEGIGRSIVSDAVVFVQGRTRVYSHGSGPTARLDPIVQEAVGELAALSYQAGAALRGAADAITRSHVAQRDGTSDATAATDAAIQATTAAQLVVLPAVLRAATNLFEIGGASATDTGRAFDRHWRNARTLASHNPTRYKARALGDTLLNDTALGQFWSTGEATPPTESEKQQHR